MGHFEEVPLYSSSLDSIVALGVEPVPPWRNGSSDAAQSLYVLGVKLAAVDKDLGLSRSRSVRRKFPVEFQARGDEHRRRTSPESNCATNEVVPVVAVRNSHSKVLLECLECVLLKTRLVEVDTYKPGLFTVPVRRE